MKELTKKQLEILNFIKLSTEKSGYPPTIREIGERFGITTKGAYDHLKAIEKKGYIRCTSNKSRAIEILYEKKPYVVSGLLNIPLVGRIAAGVPFLAEENIDDYIAFPTSLVPSGDLFALIVKGDSMIEKGIFDGDIAIIKKQSVAQSGEIVAALIDNEATLKIFKKQDNKIHLLPANKRYAPIVVDDVVILGKLVSLLRKY